MEVLNAAVDPKRLFQSSLYQTLIPLFVSWSVLHFIATVLVTLFRDCHILMSLIVMSLLSPQSQKNKEIEANKTQAKNKLTFVIQNLPLHSGQMRLGIACTKRNPGPSTKPASLHALAQTITLPLLTCLLPIVHLLPSLPLVNDAPTRPSTGSKANVIHQTRLVVGAFCGGQKS